MEEQKLSPEIFDASKENLKKLEALFPSAFKDGQLDIEALKQELGEFKKVDKEKYELTWTGKSKAKQLASIDLTGKTLNFIPEDSKNPDSTENLYIEGDNLEVLKLLRKSYYSKIKMIYIDPPYNTGHDFVYNDKFLMDLYESEIQEGNVDEEGKRYSKNLKSSNRFHARWLNNMYPRLKIARDLLTDDGVIFISIDDNEVANLKKICDEIFGEDNFIAVLIWNKQHSQQQGLFKRYHEYVFCLAKQAKFLQNIAGGEGEIDAGALKKISIANPASNFVFPEGVRFDAIDGTEYLGTFGDSEKVTIVSGRLRCKNSKTTESVILRAGWTQRNQMEKWFEGYETFDTKGQKVLEFYFNSKGKLKCRKQRTKVTPPSILPEYGMVSTQTGFLEDLMGASVFQNPKPIEMMSDFISWFVEANDFVLDFFSGSSTTAHAVMQLNAEDGGNRKFIMVQWPEEVKEKENSEAFRFLSELKKPTNICEIGKERIRRAGEKIKQELIEKQAGKLDLEEDSIDPEKLDIGFKVFRVADTNIRWLKDQTIPRELIEGKVSDKDHLDFTPGFKDIDIVYEILLRHRDIPLSSSIEVLSDIGTRTYSIASTIIVCLEENISSEIVDKLAALEPKPSKIIFRDSAFDDDISLKLNSLKRLDFQLKRFNEAKDQTYRVEFI